MRKIGHLHSKASPDTATRVDGHFADPNDANLEAIIERRLAYEIEYPVNQFIASFSDPSFLMTQDQQQKMTRYVTLLFNRSLGRRKGTQHLLEIRNEALRSFVANEVQLATVAAHWNIDAFYRGIRFARMITTNDVVQAAQRYLVADPSREAQEWYAQGTLRAIAGFDEVLYRGSWEIIPAPRGECFLLSDTPVVTWQRLASGLVNYGVGFHSDNVEVFLPMSPQACLHILPEVRRTLPIAPPSPEEINMAQAAFAIRSCFAHEYIEALDRIVQRHISIVKIGENAFTVFHRNYAGTIYDILMGRGQWVDPPRL
jgi:hypothetical protein